MSTAERLAAMDTASAALWATYAEDLAAARRSDRTIASYADEISRLAAHWPGVPLADMNATHIRAFLAAERDRISAAKGKPISGASIAVKFRALRAFFSWCEKEEMTARSPMRRVQAPATDTAPPPVPAREVISALLASCEKARRKGFAEYRDAALIRLACELGGPRRAELAAITVADIDLTRGIVRLHGKGGKARDIWIGAPTRKAITRYLRARAAHPLAGRPELWLGARGKPLTGDGIYQMLHRRCAAAGLPPLHPHQLRHFAAAEAKRHRVPTSAACALFGWDTPGMYEQVYGAAAAAEDALTLASELKTGARL